MAITGAQQNQGKLGKAEKLTDKEQRTFSQSKNARKTNPVTSQEWDTAQEFFKNNPEAIKLKCGINNSGGVDHSFIKIKDKKGNNVIVAKHGYIASGGCGVIKAVSVDDATQKLYPNQEWVVKIQDGVINPIDVTFDFCKGNPYTYFVADDRSHELHLMNTNGLALGYGNVNQKNYMFIERYPGKELMDYFLDDSERIYRLHDEQKYLIALRCAQEVKKLHDANIIHNDIKPENFMIKEIDLEGGKKDFEVHIIDFGFALNIQDKSRAVKKEDGNLFGTPCYWAPDLVLNKGYSTASDIFALGCIFTSLVDIPDNEADLRKAIIESKPGSKCLGLSNFSDMKDKTPKQRPNIEKVIERLERLVPKALHTPPQERRAQEVAKKNTDVSVTIPKGILRKEDATANTKKSVHFGEIPKNKTESGNDNEKREQEEKVRIKEERLARDTQENLEKARKDEEERERLEREKQEKERLEKEKKARKDEEERSRLEQELLKIEEQKRKSAQEFEQQNNFPDTSSSDSLKVGSSKELVIQGQNAALNETTIEKIYDLESNFHASIPSVKGYNAKDSTKNSYPEIVWCPSSDELKKENPTVNKEKTFLEKHGYKLAIGVGLVLLAGAAVVAGIFTLGIVPAITIAIAAGVIGAGGGLGLAAVVVGTVRGIYQNHFMSEDNTPPVIQPNSNDSSAQLDLGGEYKPMLFSAKSREDANNSEETSCFSALRKVFGNN